MVSYYCSLVFLLQNAFQGDYSGFVTRKTITILVWSYTSIWSRSHLTLRLVLHGGREKKYSTTNYYTTSLPQLWYGSVNGKGKMVGPYVSDSQPFTICHVKVVAKSGEIGCGPRITQGERMVPNSTAYFPNFKLWKPKSKCL